jgi:anti-sigma28 factor (negative regulator of flagellin synthesis)
MADITNIGSTVGSFNTSGVRTAGELAARRAGEQTIIETRPTGSDRVEVSEVARWLEQMNQLPAIREDKVAAARAAIANGTLDTDDKLGLAHSRMMDEVG